MRGKIPEAVRFTAADPRIEMVPESGCWLWTGFLSEKGYGSVNVARDGRSVNRRAHRLVWEVVRGPIPEGMLLDHLCRVRSCVNPDHLRVVTHRQNSTENSVGHTAVNAAKTACTRCGGPYENRASRRGGRTVHRVCRPCERANDLRWYRRRAAERRAAITAALTERPK